MSRLCVRCALSCTPAHYIWLPDSLYALELVLNGTASSTEAALMQAAISEDGARKRASPFTGERAPGHIGHPRKVCAEMATKMGRRLFRAQQEPCNTSREFLRLSQERSGRLFGGCKHSLCWTALESAADCMGAVNAAICSHGSVLHIGLCQRRRPYRARNRGGVNVCQAVRHAVTSMI